ncbi:MAG TPA: hypothetical protein VER96_30425 [Polyangiaceae bacterium]|nr:hypothetical protein [Polyangiaceae bacterium]
MYRRLSIRLLCLALFTFFTLPAFAQYTRDAAASKKIDEAINEHYLATDFDKAEQVLTGTINACGDKCSPPVIAKAWMYVGIVRGSGKNDQAGAKEAFQKALASDPSTKLDVQLATPETQKTFNDLGGAGGAAAGVGAAAAVAAPAAPAADDGAGDKGGVKCSPDVREVQTLRPIPLECTSDEEAASMELRYKSFGSEEWHTVKMKRTGEAFRGEVPCEATSTAGTLKLYVRAKDASGETVDSFGSKAKPVEFTSSESSTGAPSYPGEAAPARCLAKEECPPDFPGCQNGAARGNKGWGVACENTNECKSGLICGTEGTCESPAACETNADCESGECVENKCSGGEAPPSGGFKKNWFGLHFGQDIAIVGGTDVCSLSSRENNGYTCYDEGTENYYTGNPFPGAGISTGTVLATHRIMLSFDRTVTRNLTLGARLGFAFGGGPPVPSTTKPVPDGASPPATSKFLPFHAELRLAYWFGKGVFGKKGFRPYIHAGGGLAQVDGMVKVRVADCPESLDNVTYNKCIEGDHSVANGDYNVTVARPMDVWRKMGPGFLTAGGGAVYAITPQLGVQLNLNLMLMLPNSGFVMQPSLGAVYGF